MARSTKSDWTEGPGDLREAEVENVPKEGSSVRVRALPAAFSNKATSEATEMVQTPGGQTFKVNTEKLESLKFSYGVIDPKFSPSEAQKVAEKYGPAFNKVIAEIDRLSEVGAEDVEAAAARFPGGGAGEGGSDLGAAVGAGDGGPDVPPRVGAASGN